MQTDLSFSSSESLSLSPFLFLFLSLAEAFPLYILDLSTLALSRLRENYRRQIYAPDEEEKKKK